METHKFWKGKKVIVTGGFGFVGSHFIEYLGRNNIPTLCVFRKPNKTGSILKKLRLPSVSFQQVDLSNKKAATKHLKNADTIIHSAALDGNGEFKKQFSTLILETNTQLTFNVLNAAKENAIQSLVMMSSADIYPKIYKRKLFEHQHSGVAALHQSNGYVIAKQLLEVIAQHYAHVSNSNILIPRPSNLFGKRDNLGKSLRFIPTIVENTLAGKEVVLWGNGEQRRQFLYIEDFVKAVLGLLENNITGIVNVASRKAYSQLEIAHKIGKILKRKQKIKILNPSDPIIDTRTLDIKKLRNILSFQETPFHEAIKKSYLDKLV